MLRLLRISAVAVVALGLALPYGYSAADDVVSAQAVSSNPAIDQAVQKSVEIVRKKAVKAAKKRAARKRAIRKMTMPAWGRISARFGQSSSHWSARHTGMDIDADYGDAVYNLMKGRIIFAGRAGAYGNLVVVRTVRGGDVWYAHLSRIKLKVGAKIKSGRIIGYVGSTGNSTGSHLHLEVRKNDYPVDPSVFLWGKH